MNLRHKNIIVKLIESILCLTEPSEYSDSQILDEEVSEEIATLKAISRSGRDKRKRPRFISACGSCRRRMLR